MDYALTTMKPMQIALWDGIVMGGGVGISCLAKIRIATEKTVFAMPETAIGFYADVGGSFFLPRIKNNPSNGLYLAMTGTRLKGRELCAWGVATHYVRSDQLDCLRAELASIDMACTDE